LGFDRQHIAAKAMATVKSIFNKRERLGAHHYEYLLDRQHIAAKAMATVKPH